MEANPLEPHQGPTAAILSRGKTHSEYLHPAFGHIGTGVMVLSINTYIGAQELFDNQRDILRSFEQFGECFRREMQKLRAGMMRGLPDPRMVGRFGEVLDIVEPEDLKLLACTLERFFGTPEWRTHAEAHRRPIRFLH